MHLKKIYSGRKMHLLGPVIRTDLPSVTDFNKYDSQLIW